jgi:hypothetical protein
VRRASLLLRPQMCLGRGQCGSERQSLGDGSCLYLRDRCIVFATRVEIQKYVDWRDSAYERIGHRSKAVPSGQLGLRKCPMKDGWVEWAGGAAAKRGRGVADGMDESREQWEEEREENDGRGGVLWRTSRSIPCSSVAQKPYARPGLPKRGSSIS